MPRPTSPPGPDVTPRYRMTERALHGDFGIRDQDSALPNPTPHRHEYFQIHVQLAGHTQHFLGGASRPVGPGTLCFVLPFKTHFIPTVAGSRYYILNASAAYLLPSVDGDLLALEDMPIERAPELAPFRFQEQLDFQLDDTQAAEVQRLCMVMADEDRHRTGGSTLMIRGCLLQLIALAWRQQGEALAQLARQPSAGLTRRQALARLLVWLRDRLAEPVALADAAAAVHLSASHLAHLVKRETGQTFVELVTARRLAYARELLVHSPLSVKEIAYRCGFADEAYFTRRFRQIEGLTPSQARTQLRGEAP